MQLHEARRADLSNKKKMRVGRGPGSGLGKTAGRGIKGATSRSGYAMKVTYEGGQMPLFRAPAQARVPQRPVPRTFHVVNVGELAEFKAGARSGRTNCATPVLRADRKQSDQGSRRRRTQGCADRQRRCVQQERHRKDSEGRRQGRMDRRRAEEEAPELQEDRRKGEETRRRANPKAAKQRTEGRQPKPEGGARRRSPKRNQKRKPKARPAAPNPLPRPRRKAEADSQLSKADDASLLSIAAMRVVFS